MLHKILKRFRVSEVHLCLPFVQVTLEAVRTETTSETVTEPTPAGPRPAARFAETVNLSVQERPTPPGITISPLASALRTELSYRLAHQVDTFGPVFASDWQLVEKGMELRPGDFLWLRLSCQNESDRVVHKVRIAMEGIEIVRRQVGILVRGVNGWPRTEVRDVFSGHELPYINPGEDYSLHCVLRVPTDLHSKPRARFVALKPEFNILKQLG